MRISMASSFTLDRRKTGGGGMTGDEMGPAMTLDHTPVPLAHHHTLVQHTETRGAPEQHGDLRIDDIKLPAQMDSAVDDIRRTWLAPCRAIRDRTGEVGGLFVQPDVSDRAAEPHPCPADERPPGLRLLSAGCFADEHNLGIRVPLAQDRLTQGIPSASPTGLDPLCDLLQGLGLVRSHGAAGRHSRSAA